ncbi:MAG TPA: MFS transporter, partial [Solirubrobacteraceae bacterium]|nr:MFS transporter [Solirubrobacteraceae bacterium]
DGNVVAFVANWGVFAVFFFTAFYLELIANLSPARIAAEFAAMAAAMWLAAAAGSWMTVRAGPARPMAGGCLLAGIGLLLVNSVLSPNVGFVSLAWSLAIVGFGLGMTFVAMTAAVLTTVPAPRSGMAASTVNTSRELGGVFGVAILGAILNGQITGSLAQRLTALGVPANFRAIVIDAVTHGGVPKSAPAVGPAAGHAALVSQVIHAAENAFVGGLHLSLLLAGAMLLASAVAVLISGRRPGVRGRTARVYRHAAG